MLKKIWNRPITWGDSITWGLIGCGLSVAMMGAMWWNATKDERAEKKKEKHVHRIESDTVKEEDFED